MFDEDLLHTRDAVENKVDKTPALVGCLCWFMGQLRNKIPV